MTAAYAAVDGGAAVVTGAGSGIGRASALALAARGASVMVSDVDGERAEVVAAEIVAAGGHARARRCDVTLDADLDALRVACLEELGRVDVVMSNVGVITMGAPETLPLEEWQRVIDINLMGTVRTNLAFLPVLLEQGSGHVVYTASAAGLLPYGFDRLPYLASKHAIVGIARSLALYLRPQGVGVTCLCPSGVVTNIVEQIRVVGEARTPVAPPHPVVEAEVVGELVADAVEHGTFLVVTAQEAIAESAELAADTDGYLDRHVATD